MLEGLSQPIVNGKLLNFPDFNKVSFLSPSFQYGLTVFEGIRCYKNSRGIYVPFLLKKHIDRLLKSANLLGMNINFTENDIKNDIDIIINYKKIENDIYIKYILAYKDDGSWHSTNSPDRICFYYSSPSCFNERKLNAVNARFTSISRITTNSLPPKIKCGANYINSRLAYLDVNDGDSEKILPIFIDKNGFIAESSGSCLFIIVRNKVITPKLTSPILQSITRDFILREISKQIKKVEFIEADIDRWDLLNADYIFFCGTNAELTRVKKLATKKYPKDNDIFQDIFRAFKGSFN